MTEPSKLMDENCALCGFKLSANAAVYTEGKFCAESAGCRRRALIQKHSYQTKVFTLTKTIEGLIGGLSALTELVKHIEDWKHARD